MNKILLCSIFNRAASTSMPHCVLSLKLIDVNCHGGTIGDGHVVCVMCVGKSYVVANFK